MAVFAVLLGVSTGVAGVRPPDLGGTTKSMGMPERVDFYGGASVGGQFKGENVAVGYLKFGLYRSIGNPATGAFGFLPEVYVGVDDRESDGGFRLSLMSPFLRIGLGADYNVPAEEVDFLFTFVFPVRRVGIFGHGTDLRFEWLPTRDQSINLAITVPLWKSYAGKTRTRHDYARIPKSTPVPIDSVENDPALEEALENLRILSHWVNRLTTPYLDQAAWGRKKSIEKFSADMNEFKAFFETDNPMIPGGVTSESVARRYHEELDRAFSIAISGQPLEPGQSTSEGRRIAGIAKEIILEEVILAYNRSLGQQRKKDTTNSFAVNARGRFVRWVIMNEDRDAAGSERWRSVGYTFLALLDMIETNREYSRKRWENSALVWMPLQYALRPEQHDSQEEVDKLIERAVAQNFTPGNDAWYLRDEQFQYEYHRMVQAAEDYHILWIHDYSGVNDQGKPDKVAFEQTKNYLEAMTRRVREYDTTGKLPVYMIAISQFYWEVNKGRIWSALLQDPLGHKLKLGDKDYKWMEEEIAAMQEDLRTAVAESHLLQTSAGQYGQKWLKNQVKVHINITNPPDPTFRSRQVIPLLGIPDNIMIDHRKISFYDITEEDPYRGMAIYTGMGVGEHYSGPTWEDRALLVRGPAVLDLKYAARDLFLSQGFSEDEVPYPLRSLPKPHNYDDMVNRNVDPVGGRVSRALQVHNLTGYAPKRVDVAKAILYTMMPGGSLIKTPDSLWSSVLWGSMLVGSSLRGCRVVVISPAIAAAPSSGFPQMSRAQELMERLLIVREILGPEIASAGGFLRVGIYDPDVGVGDLIGRTKAIRKTWEENEFLQNLYNLDPAVFEAIDEVVAKLEAEGFKEKYLVNENLHVTPKLHMKAQLFVSKEAWDKCISRPEWADAYKLFAAYQSENQTDATDLSGLEARGQKFDKIRGELLNNFLPELTPEERERIVYYISVGSHNMNYRSLLMDGEVICLVTYYGAIAGIMDFVGLTGLCKWPETREQLNELLPPYGGTKRKMGRIAKTAV
jgi:hypothetical protein